MFINGFCTYTSFYIPLADESGEATCGNWSFGDKHSVNRSHHAEWVVDQSKNCTYETNDLMWSVRTQATAYRSGDTYRFGYACRLDNQETGHPNAASKGSETCHYMTRDILTAVMIYLRSPLDSVPSSDCHIEEQQWVVTVGDTHDRGCELVVNLKRTHDAKLGDKSGYDPTSKHKLSVEEQSVKVGHWSVKASNDTPDCQQVFVVVRLDSKNSCATPGTWTRPVTPAFVARVYSCWMDLQSSWPEQWIYNLKAAGLRFLGLIEN